MLPHDGFGPASLPPLDGAQDAAVLVLRHGENMMQLRRPRLHRDESARRGEGERADPFELACQGRAIRHGDQDPVKPRVQLDILQEIDLDPLMADDLIDFVEAFGGIAQVGPARPVLGGETRRQSLEGAADLDGLEDFLFREGLDGKAAGGGPISGLASSSPHPWRSSG